MTTQTLPHKVTWMVVALLGLPTVSAADPLDAVEKELKAKWAEVKTLTAHMTMTMHQKGFTAKTKGTYQYKREDGKGRSRTDMKSVTTIKQGPKPQTIEGSTMLIDDGEYHYALIRQPGSTIATRTKAPQTPMLMDVERWFSALRADHKLRLLDPRTVDDQAVNVIEAKPIAQTGANAGSKTEAYFAKTSGLMMKFLVYDKSGKIFATTTFRDIKLDVEIPSDRFVFKAPPGVQVIDITTKPNRKSARK